MKFAKLDFQIIGLRHNANYLFDSEKRDYIFKLN